MSVAGRQEFDSGQVSAELQRAPIKIYHERQSKQLCALHALNNLFQSPDAFTKQDLDKICKELSPDSRFFNPHRSALGLGCYDVNVIISALAKNGFDVVWFDKRKELSKLNLKNIFGFIMNVPNISSSSFLSVPISYIPAQARVWSSQRHWISIKRVGPTYYNLDSKLESPKPIGNEDDLMQYLQRKIPLEQVELLIIVTKIVSDSQSWLVK